MITAEALIQKFRQALEEHWGYIWGTSGEPWTETKQKVLEKTTDPDRAQGRAYGSKWIGHTVADCSGLFSWAFKKLGGYMYHGSDTMFRKYCTDKGELKQGKRADRGTLKPGTAVFVWNGKTYSHVGLYVGDNTVIEAMSTINGVTTSRVTAGKWTHWGELSGVDYAAENSQFHDRRDQSSNRNFDGCNVAAVTQIKDLDSCSTIHNSQLNTETPGTIRRGSKGEAVRKCQEILDRLGFDLGSWGVDGDFGKDTLAAVKAFQKEYGLERDGIVGPKTWEKLLQLASSCPERKEGRG